MSKKFEAGVWEQDREFVAWSNHSTAELAQQAARKYARKRTAQTGTGGPLSWSGGVRGPDGAVTWYRADGSISE